MKLAPSFSNFVIEGEIFLKNGKPYIKARNPKTNHVRDCRVYDYRPEPEVNRTRPYRDVRGFGKGPITILVSTSNKFNAITHEEQEWCENSIARYAVGIGWHIVSEDSIPLDLPPTLKCVQMSWEEFKGDDENHSKPASILAAIVRKKVKEVS